MNPLRATRHIHSSSRSGELRELLQSIFVAELVSPSRSVWLVSPWISDIFVIDNQANSFKQIVPDWPRANICLSQVIIRMLESGTTVNIATRDTEVNHGFLSALAIVDSSHLRIHKNDELHEKGLLGDDYYLSGSMNFTFSGIHVNEELVHFITEPTDVAHNRVILAQRWGGECK